MVRTVVNGLLAAIAILVLGACGHDGGVGVQLPDPPPDPVFPVITGGVLAPNRILASESTWTQRFASLVVPNAEALAPNVQPIGAGALVSLVRIDPVDAADGVISGDEFLTSGPTNSGGRFIVEQINAAVGDCGLMLRVGSKTTLMRALVFDGEDQDLRAESETVVRLILDHIRRTHVSLCNYDLEELGILTGMVEDVAADVGGNSVEELNDNVEAVAAANPAIQDAIVDFGNTVP